MSNIIKIIFSTFISLISLFALSKLMGNRSISQLSAHDYITGVAIGSIAGELAIMSSGSIIEPLVSMTIFALSAVFINIATCKSIYARRFFEENALLLYQNGQLYEKNLLKARIDIGELLSICRINGYYNLEEVHTVYLEANGQFSVLPLAKNRPLTADDIKLEVSEDRPLANIIIDGRIMSKNLKNAGRDFSWLEKELKIQQAKDLKEIALATYDSVEEKLNIYYKYNKEMLKDIFQ